MQFFRKSGGLIASILVAGMGAMLCFSGLGMIGVPLYSAKPIVGSYWNTLSLIGMPLFVCGLALSVWQAATLIRNRPDPYDLSKLWETEPEPADEPDEDWGENKSLGFCHNCGHAVPEPYARCPDCGTPVR